MKTKTPKSDKAPKPRRVPVIAPPPIVEEDDADSFEGLPADEAEEKLSEFLEQFGGKEYKVRVEQFHATDKVWEFLDTFAVDGFDAYDVCKRYGRGRYRMTFLDERGKYVRGGQPQIRIGGAAPSAAPAQAPVESDPFKNPVVAMILAQAEASRKESAELLRALLTRPEPQKSSTSEVLDLVVKMEALKPKSDDSTKKLMDAVMGSLIERALNPEEKAASGGGLLSEAREGLAMLKEVGFLDRTGRRGPSPAAPVTRVLPNPAEPPKPEPEPTQLESPMIQSLRPYVAIFRMKAENGVEVEQAASYLIDEVYETMVPLIRKNVFAAKLASEEMIIDNLINRAAEPGQIEEVFKFAPELEPHRAWVVAVINRAIEIFKTPETTEEANAA